MDVILIFIIYKRIVCFTNIIYQYINTFASQSSIMNKSIARIVVFIFKNMFVDLSCSNTVHSVHHPHPPHLTPFLLGVLNLLPNFQKGGGLGRTSNLRGGLLKKRGVTFFRGVSILPKK